MHSKGLNEDLEGMFDTLREVDSTTSKIPLEKARRIKPEVPASRKTNTKTKSNKPKAKPEKVKVQDVKTKTKNKSHRVSYLYLNVGSCAVYRSHIQQLRFYFGI